MKDDDLKELNSKQNQMEMGKNENEIVTWIKNNKKAIYLYICTIGITGVVSYLLGKNSSSELVDSITKELKNVQNELRNTKLKISQLEFSNYLKDVRIAGLEELCEKKDRIMNKVMSDGLRNGSSEAAKQMRAKQDYLNKH